MSIETEMLIQTFVFFDLETTGLPSLEANRTKITELTFLAVSRRDLEEANSTRLPPVNKLSLLFNPQRKIHPEAAKITGLTNELLKNQPLFSHKINSINDFLDLPKPVCLVAHNGNRFDYKILRTEYIDSKSDLPNDLLCVDSLKAFKDILKETSLNESNTSLNEIYNDSRNSIEWPEMNITPDEFHEIDNLTDSFLKLTSTPKKEKIRSTARNYKLTSLYEDLLYKKPVQSHRAEADCLMLLECTIATKERFLEWADKNHQLLSEIKPYQRK